tara:strand:- start:555 stop:1292 length:738 start_codon:yes stop_codon:yes gene_type:complete
VKIFKLTFCISLFLTLSTLFGSEPKPKSYDGCSELILEYLARMESLAVPKVNKVYYIKYKIKTEFSKVLNTPNSETTTEVLTSKEKIMVIDKNMEVFGDDKNVFVVIPRNQKIFWNESDPIIYDNTNSYKRFVEIQKVVLESASNIKCSSDNGITVITVTPGKEFSSKSNVILQTITYDNKLKKVLKVSSIYNDKSRIKKQTMVYEVLDFDSSKKIVAPITALFKDNQLKDKYKGFEIIDNRQKQ